MVRALRHPNRPSPAAFADWRSVATERLASLLALPPGPHPGRLMITAGPTIEPRLVTLRTATEDIPCWFIGPPPDRASTAAVVAIAGHGPGIDALVGVGADTDEFHGGLAHKLAAAGFTVLCPELISFGRRRTPTASPAEPSESSCQVDAMRGLLTGRPVLGRRVSDALAAVDALRALDGIDPTKIAIVGGSGGGAVAMITAALDQRIAAAVVGTFFSAFEASFCAIPHCICNAVPHLLDWFEMADIAAMIAPRGVIIEAGRQDPIFPIEATEAAYAELVEVWEALAAGRPDLVVTDAGHRFLAHDAIALLRDRLTAPP